jgi:hypothetical protein
MWNTLIRAGLWLALGCCAPVDAAPLRLTAGDDGAMAIDARDASIADTLNALASQSGFDVWLDDRQRRPPVTLQVERASIEELLHELLRGRNYAIVYGGDGGLDRVIVLAPSTAGSHRAPPPPRRARVARPRTVQTVVR